MTEPTLKTAEGRLTKIDFGTRMLQFRPDKEFAVDIFWSPNQDEKMSKFKDGYKAKVTYEKDKTGKCWLSDIISTYKPGDKSKGDYQQKKSDGYILFESIFKTRTELYIETTDLSQVDFDVASEKILAGMERDYSRIMELVKAGDA